MKMVFSQRVLSWFGESVELPKSNVESNDRETLETVTPASDLVTELNGHSMEINGYMVPPSTTENGELAKLWPHRRHRQYSG